VLPILRVKNIASFSRCAPLFYIGQYSVRLAARSRRERDNANLRAIAGCFSGISHINRCSSHLRLSRCLVRKLQCKETSYEECPRRCFFPSRRRAIRALAEICARRNASQKFPDPEKRSRVLLPLASARRTGNGDHLETREINFAWSHRSGEQNGLK